MHCEVRISKAGSIAIPTAVRKAFGIKPGQKVEHFIDRKTLVIRILTPTAIVTATVGLVIK